jgi:CBS domain-containing protein
MILDATKAKDLMRPDPVSIVETATIREGVAFLVDKGFSAAPVIDHAGRPVGVLSRTDILMHDREQVHHLTPHYSESNLATEKQLSVGFQVEEVDQTSIKEIMTPVVYSVLPEAPVTEVIDQMLGLKVHRLFVVDTNGVLVGVISITDVLHGLRLENGTSLGQRTSPSGKWQWPVDDTTSGEFVPYYAEVW